ncbi:hypothetical protein ACOME3_008741 [Neoechinorhynchus agilis]
MSIRPESDPTLSCWLKKSKTHSERTNFSSNLIDEICVTLAERQNNDFDFSTAGLGLEIASFLYSKKMDELHLQALSIAEAMSCKKRRKVLNREIAKRKCVLDPRRTLIPGTSSKLISNGAHIDHSGNSLAVVMFKTHFMEADEPFKRYIIDQYEKSEFFAQLDSSPDLLSFNSGHLFDEFEILTPANEPLQKLHQSSKLLNDGSGVGNLLVCSTVTGRTVGSLLSISTSELKLKCSEHKICLDFAKVFKKADRSVNQLPFRRIKKIVAKSKDHAQIRLTTKWIPDEPNC